MIRKRTVAIGFIGATLDRVGKGANRWNKWRPSIGPVSYTHLDVYKRQDLHFARSVIGCLPILFG